MFVDGLGEQANRHRKAFVRKLRLCPEDQALFEPLSLVEQATHMATRQQDSLGYWISSLIMFIAFDTVAAHTLPRDPSIERALPPAAALYRRVALPQKAVNVREILLCTCTKHS